jgi:hypothetical protein
MARKALLIRTAGIQDPHLRPMDSERKTSLCWRGLNSGMRERKPMKGIGVAVVVGLVWLIVSPTGAATLTSGTFGLSGLARVSCGVTYKDEPPTSVTIEIFDREESLLEQTLALSPEEPASWWRTATCGEDGCVAPWCKVTVESKRKKKIRAAMCVESVSDDDGSPVYTALACVPVD